MTSANQSKPGRKGVQGQLLGGRMLNDFIEAVSFVTFSNFRYFLTLVLQCNGQHQVQATLILSDIQVFTVYTKRSQKSEVKIFWNFVKTLDF